MSGSNRVNNLCRRFTHPPAGPKGQSPGAGGATLGFAGIELATRAIDPTGPVFFFFGGGGPGLLLFGKPQKIQSLAGLRNIWAKLK